MSILTYAALLGAAASCVSAHGHVQYLKVDNTWVQGWDTNYMYRSTKPVVAAWSTQQGDQGFTSPSEAQSGNKIVCATDAQPGGTDLPIQAGQSLSFVWGTESGGYEWPASHYGPVLTYLAKCPTDTCVGVDPASLRFFKIAEEGLITPGVTQQGAVWASDKLRANNQTASAVIPTTLPNGAYVARHEIIALHSAGQQNGAQFYPQCANIKVSGGSGSMSTDGISANALYSPTDPGVLINIYQNLASYTIPGPQLRTGSGSGSGGSPAPAPAPTTTRAPTSTYAPPAPTTAAPTTAAPTTTVKPAAPTGGAGSTKPIPEGVTLEDLLAWLKVILNRTSPIKRSEFFGKMLM